MQPAVTDLERTIVYSRDRWQMRLVPGALLLAAGGLLVVVLGEASLGASLRAGAVIAAGFLILLLTGHYLIFQIFEGRSRLLRLLSLLIVAVALHLYFAGGGSLFPGKARVGIEAAGGFLAVAGLGYVGYALYRHWVPGAPILMLSPAGVRLHYVWLPDVEIPWSSIKAIEQRKGFASPLLLRGIIDIPALQLPRETFDRLIESKRNFLAEPHWRSLFVIEPKWALVLLHPGAFALKSEDIGKPLLARWKAFRKAPPVPFGAVPAVEPIVLGRWRDERSWNEALAFGAPLAAVLALLLYAIALRP